MKKLFIGVILIIFFFIFNLNGYKKYDIKICRYINNYKLKIPSISLEIIFNNNSILDNSVEITNNSPLVLSGHSGNGYNAVFNNLDYLKVGDEIILYHGKNKITYVLESITYFKKYSEVIIPQNNEYIYLITCDKKDMGLQLIFSGKVSKSVKYC